MKRIRILAISALSIFLVLAFYFSSRPEPEPKSREAIAAALVGSKKVQAAYQRWVTRHEANGGDRNVVMALGYSNGLSSKFTSASGLAKLDLTDGSVSVTVKGLPADSRWDVWLVDNRPGPAPSVKPEPTDLMINAGRLAQKGDALRLKANLGSGAFERFHVDQVVVARAGEKPAKAGVLYGSPPLFQRLYTALRSKRLLSVSDFRSRPGITVQREGRSLFGVPPANAARIFMNAKLVFDDLVAHGADLFINEQFDGNGRTCATCHPPLNNFTIDPKFIATLPDDDALFVAEFNPALAFDPNGPKFEVPVLMRGAGLIVENQDGMHDLINIFNMRGVPHTLALSTSLTPSRRDGTTIPGDPLPDGSTADCCEDRPGWSGDGAPAPGALRNFATGAVNQHFPKTLNRVVGPDFRLPTDAELDAMEAFQLSLGRQTNPELPLGLTGARASLGQDIFLATGPMEGAGNCNVCHFNAGATAIFDPGANRNFDTGVEDQPDRPAEAILRYLGLDLTPNIPENILPRDGGFGPTPGEGPNGTGSGNGTFSTPPLVEFADTGPYFHDNSIETVEGAIAFYNSDQFNDAALAAGIQINLAATQVEAVGAFLRVVNALDNIREATETGKAVKYKQARGVTAYYKYKRARGVTADLIDAAIAETEDAVEVLSERGLHPDAVESLNAAIAEFESAKKRGFGRRLKRDIEDALAHLAAARDALCQGNCDTSPMDGS